MNTGCKVNNSHYHLKWSVFAYYPVSWIFWLCILWVWCFSAAGTEVFIGTWMPQTQTDAERSFFVVFVFPQVPKTFMITGALLPDADTHHARLRLPDNFPDAASGLWCVKPHQLLQTARSSCLTQTFTPPCDEQLWSVRHFVSALGIEHQMFKLLLGSWEWISNSLPSHLHMPVSEAVCVNVCFSPITTPFRAVPVNKDHFYSSCWVILRLRSSIQRKWSSSVPCCSWKTTQASRNKTF